MKHLGVKLLLATFFCLGGGVLMKHGLAGCEVLECAKPVWQAEFANAAVVWCVKYEKGPAQMLYNENPIGGTPATPETVGYRPYTSCRPVCDYPPDPPEATPDGIHEITSTGLPGTRAEEEVNTICDTT